MHFRIMLWKSKITIIKSGNILFIYIWSNFAFIPIYHVKGVQDDISSKTIRIWLRNAVWRGKGTLDPQNKYLPYIKKKTETYYSTIVFVYVAPKKNYSWKRVQKCKAIHVNGLSQYNLCLNYSIKFPPTGSVCKQ